MIEHTVQTRLPNGAFGQRVRPKMPTHVYRTFEVSSPLTTHFRDATCKEVECPNYIRGWKTVIDLTAELGPKRANYIRMHSGRHYTHEVNGSVVTFYFPPGQKCFTQHKVPLGRPEFFVVRGGDWRGNPRGEVRRHTKPEFFVEEFEANLAALRNRIAQG